MTPPEAALWLRLRSRGPDRPTFRRQHGIGPFILDFYCAAARLAVEIDGLVHDNPDQAAHDARRSRWLADKGISIIRVPASDVLRNPADIAEWLLDHARAAMEKLRSIP